MKIYIRKMFKVQNKIPNLNIAQNYRRVKQKSYCMLRLCEGAHVDLDLCKKRFCKSSNESCWISHDLRKFNR